MELSMRQRFIATIFVVLTGFGLFSQPAQATCRDGCAPAGWGTVRTVKHWGYSPRYQHVYAVNYVTDPYAYRYEPRTKLLFRPTRNGRSDSSLPRSP